MRRNHRQLSPLALGFWILGAIVVLMAIGQIMNDPASDVNQLRHNVGRIQRGLTGKRPQPAQHAPPIVLPQLPADGGAQNQSLPLP